jgi:ABC-type branched-subunit amino acid transport system ATPase component
VIDPADSPPAIIASGLTRKFGAVVAVDHVDLTIRAPASMASSGPTARANRRRSA